MASPLTNVVPAKARRYVYLAYVLAVAVAGGLAASGVDVGIVPQILVAVGGALGLVAHQNTTVDDG